MRTITLAAAATDTGIRCYTKSADGNVREACHNLNLKDIEEAVSQGNKAIVDQADSWFPGEFGVQCHPDSSLFSFAWASWSQAVFYQTIDNCIHERRHLNDWQDHGFLQEDAYPGTDMAAIWSDNADTVMIFFQDSEEYLCYRTANNWQWENHVRLCKAAPGTGIAAATWNNINNARVYYQDETNVVREYCRNFNGVWVPGDFQYIAEKPVNQMAAVSWSNEIRLYLEGGSGKLVEWCQSDTGGQLWYPGEFQANALPNSDIVAFVRHLESGPLINVMWAGPDRLLYQQVFAPDMRWLNSTPIAYLSKAGSFVGSPDGAQFNDGNKNIGTEVIRKVTIRSGGLVDGVSISYVDGSSTPWHGGQGGGLFEFILEEGEDITQVLGTSDREHIQSLLFVTSNGRESPRYGGMGGDTFVWEEGGKALNGFAGSENRYLNGLMPIWSPRQSSIGPATLNQLIHEAEQLTDDINTAKGRTDEIQGQTDALRHDIEEGLRPPAQFALEGVSILIQSIFDLSRIADSDEDSRSALVGRCKSQSTVVATRFDNLHKESKKCMEQGKDLMLMVTYQTTIAHNRIKRVEDMLTISDAMRVNAEKVKQLKEEQVRDSVQTIERARGTWREAEEKKAENEKARIVRDIFTFGLGEIGDWGDLNEAIDYASKLIANCENDLRQRQQALNQVEDDLSAIVCELQKFDNLKFMLGSYTPRLEGQVIELNRLREKNMELTNKGLDLSLFLGKLCAMTETFDISNSARQFANNVLAVGAAINISVRVELGVLMQGEEDIGKTLQMIASSPILASGDYGDLM